MVNEASAVLSRSDGPDGGSVVMVTLASVTCCIKKMLFALFIELALSVKVS